MSFIFEFHSSNSFPYQFPLFFFSFIQIPIGLSNMLSVKYSQIISHIYGKPLKTCLHLVCNTKHNFPLRYRSTFSIEREILVDVVIFELNLLTSDRFMKNCFGSQTLIKISRLKFRKMNEFSGLLVICLTFLNAWKQMLSVGKHFSEKRVHAYFTCSKFSEVGKVFRVNE